MNYQHNKDEKVIKDMIQKNVKPTDNRKEILTYIYYRNHKAHNLIMTNNLIKKYDILTMSQVV